MLSREDHDLVLEATANHDTEVVLRLVKDDGEWVKGTRVGLNKAFVEEHRDRLEQIVRSIPDIDHGPSYIAIAGSMGCEQMMAFFLIAVGKQLGILDIKPDPEAEGAQREMAIALYGADRVGMFPMAILKKASA